MAVESKLIQKIVHPTYVGINEGTMNIVSVKTTDKATTVTFQYQGEGFGSFNPDIYIEDEQGTHYGLIGQKGFSQDSLKRLIPSKKGKYELLFKPLPEGTRIFDLIENFYSIGGSKYYGIREKDTPFSIDNPKSHDEGVPSLPDIDFKIDSVLVTGRIVNYSPEKCKFKKVLRYSIHATEYAEEGKSWPFFIASINEDGSFQTKIRVIGPTWTYLMLAPKDGLSGSMFIPVMLYPDDHIDLQIAIDDRDIQKRVTYNSERKKDFSNLMQCAPIIHVDLNCTFAKGKDYSKDYEEMTIEGVQKSFNDYDSMGLYLSGKYGLSRLETEMLRSHLSVVTAVNVIGLTNRYLLDLHEKDVPTEKREAAYNNWRNSDSPYYGICFSNVRAENNTFLTTPYWTILLSTHNMHHISRHEKQFNDFLGYRHNIVFDRKLDIVETGEPILLPSNTLDAKNREEDFEKQYSELYYNWMLRLIREWRQKSDNDSLFEQAYLLCCTRDMGIGFGLTLDRIYQQFTQCRNLFQHPSIVRMAGKLIEKREERYFQEIENHLKKKEDFQK